MCGVGNNGGDGFVLARLAHSAGLDPRILSVGDAKNMKGEAADARSACAAAGISVTPFNAQALHDSDIVVDALLGTGLTRPVEGAWREAIDIVNELQAEPILAVDIPSGLNADSGAVMGAAVRAHTTVTFVGLKSGLFTGSGREHGGEIIFADLQIPPDVCLRSEPIAQRLKDSEFQNCLRPRPRDAHKGDMGHVLIVGGDRGMGGAVRLAGEAAYRAGAGLVTVLTRAEHVALVGAARPELLVYGVDDWREARVVFERASVVAVGPGLGQSPWSKKLFDAALASGRPLVIDADGLNLLAKATARRDDWILTPHPGEAARLLGLATGDIQADRFSAVNALNERYGGVSVLKGSGTLIAKAGVRPVSLCDRGNPGMASAGMGDVLTGVVAALLAQGLETWDAARLAVWLHALAGDDAARRTTGDEIGLLASDLFPFLRAHINRISHDTSM
jgi:NAD(P)H-hydrate epimerase